MASKTEIKLTALHPIKDNVFVCDLEAGTRRTLGGIILPDDNMTARGVHARWGRVYAIGPEVSEVKVGEYILIEHGRWTLGIDLLLPDSTVRVWRVEWPAAVLLVAESDPRSHVKHDFNAPAVPSTPVVSTPVVSAPEQTWLAGGHSGFDKELPPEPHHAG